ncbi:MAG: elongation factor G, partial [Lentisphaeria bacterium]|nr:elongation factor G [Lentisphaeria bacterium]
MKIENPGKIRNFAVAGHNGSGKTTLCDLMLFKAGAVERLGSVDAGTSVSDFTPDEQEKRSSIYSAYLNCSWEGNHFFFTDTPGYGEFVGEVISAFRSCGFAAIVLDGDAGIEIGTTRAWRYAKEFKIPKLVVVNRLDRTQTDFYRVLDQLQEAYGKTVCVPMTLPVGKEENLSRVVSVLTTPENEIPDDLKDMVAKYKEQLLDTVAESNEELMERYLGGESLTEEEISRGLHNAIFAGDLVPVFATSAAKDIGVSEMMNGLTYLMPNPLERIRPAADGTVVEPKEDG